MPQGDFREIAADWFPSFFATSVPVETALKVFDIFILEGVPLTFPSFRPSFRGHAMGDALDNRLWNIGGDPPHPRSHKHRSGGTGFSHRLHLEAFEGNKQHF